ncbi:MAG: 1-deoxy-D-xylulose-5-phosphate synthase [Youngiibacter sp.]|nr:1-deoxy-D-xylulose-5-phosphate synthase [Youngiibacter sp.]
MGILRDRYRNPEDIKELTMDELYQLSDEIRAFLIESVSKTGGHLAPNLGVVELTVALFNVFDLEKDRIIYDVGHQSYVHKMLTHRLDEFVRLRKYKGLSGFPKREESKYDAFDTGHSSTSISAGLGYARARDIAGDDYNVISVIGDGALTGGMAFEALNDLGFSKTRMVIVLNDNQMSISRNVGGISTYLSQLRGDNYYEKVKKDIQDTIDRMPMGRTLNTGMMRIKNSVKTMLVPGMLFEDMGLKYLGPVDGHNIKDMSKVLKVARDFNGPVIVHVRTQKGKGYVASEKRPDQFHGIAPFNKQNGEVMSKVKVTYSKVFGEAVTELGRKNGKVCAITAAMPDGTGLSAFKKEFPARFFDVGIAEQHAATLAAGLAVAGMKPYIGIYSTFLQRAYDQVIHDICIQKLPVVIGIDRAGIVGDDGETHQGILDLSFLSAVPNLTIMAPKSLKELHNMVLWSESFDGPLAIRYPRGGDPAGYDPEALSEFTPGKFEIVTEGTDGYIYATGKMVQRAEAVVKELEGKGLRFGIVNACFIKPVDFEMIRKHCEENMAIVTLEDNVVHGGLGSQILEAVNDMGLSATVVRFGFRDTFVVQGDPESLYRHYGLDTDSIVSKIAARLCKGECDE